MVKKFRSSLLVVLLNLGVFQAQVWKDPKASVDKRVENLLSKMTLDEKISYCGSIIPAIDRLGIPTFEWYAESLHGVKGWNCTQFPQNNALGSTWNPGLMFDVATAISNECRALKNAGKQEVMMFAPTVNMARDPRWGRNEECYSEDPHLMSEMARMYVRGMQGNDPKYVKTVTTVKHFATNNVDTRREFSHSLVRQEDLYEYYFPAYKTCIVDEEATGIMTALNGLNGVPCSAHNWLVNGVLRNEWGFKGYVIADWAAIQGVEKRLRYAKTQEEAAAMAIKAGVDQECFRHKTNQAPFVTALKPALKQGLLTEKEIDVSVKRLLRLRFMTGDFDNPSLNPYSKIPLSVLECDSHKKLALKAAEQSIVLLKNDNILPLKDNDDKLAVIGPFAKYCWLGIYSGNPKSKISNFAGIQKRAKGEVSFAEGCSITGSKEDQQKIDEAVALAKTVKTVVLIVGNDESTATETRDRVTLSLPGNQHKLIKAVQAVNKNIVLVLVPSGSTSIGWEKENIPGIICAWANGQEQGTALAKVLFGDINPGGKLNTSWVKSEKDLPFMHDYNVKTWKDDYSPEVARTYMYAKTEPLFPFGFGLSYTQFQIQDVKINKTDLKQKEDVIVEAKVSNVGGMDGDEIVQIYVRDIKSDRTVPVKALKGFKRIKVAAGKSETITVKLPYEAFSYYNTGTKEFQVEEGDFEILVGQSSDKIVATKTIKVQGGSIAPIKVGQKSGYFNAEDEVRTKKWDYLYEGNAIESKKAVQEDDSKYDWVEYEITFIDPGVYVSKWDAELNFADATNEAIIVTSMSGLEIESHTILNNQRKLQIKIPIPPEYGKPVRLKIKTVSGKVDHQSIKIIPPGNKESFVISEIAKKSQAKH